MNAMECPAQSSARWLTTSIPEACRDRLGRGGEVGQDTTCKERQLWQTPTALGSENEGTLRPKHLLCRQWQLFDGPTVPIQPPHCLRRNEQVGRQDQRLVIARIVNNDASRE